ncbi:MAG: hypothetical protein Q9160_004025 [Pyrenula sp. 1 TL-2023]
MLWNVLWPLGPLKTPTATRILYLFPSADFNAPLQGYLQEIDLSKAGGDECPEYECLSYTWGEPPQASEPFYSIVINLRKVAIRENLFQALKRLRLQSYPRMLWIDALSIRQDDLLEKAQQVQMISKIFHQAIRLLVWLGEHADGSEMLFSDEAFIAVANANRKELMAASDSTTVEESLGEMMTVWAKFASRPYWWRTWIVQEIACGRDPLVHCGPDSAEWGSLAGTQMEVKKLHQRIERSHTGYAKFDSTATSSFDNGLRLFIRLGASRAARSGEGNFMGTIGLAAVGTKCSDRRDKIYALLGLTADENVRERLKVDYSISVSELAFRVLEIVGESGHRPTCAGLIRSVLGLDQSETLDFIEKLRNVNETHYEDTMEYLQRGVRNGVDALGNPLRDS